MYFVPAQDNRHGRKAAHSGVTAMGKFTGCLGAALRLPAPLGIGAHLVQEITQKSAGITTGTRETTANTRPRQNYKDEPQQSIESKPLGNRGNALPFPARNTSPCSVFTIYQEAIAPGFHSDADMGFRESRVLPSLLSKHLPEEGISWPKRGSTYSRVDIVPTDSGMSETNVLRSTTVVANRTALT